MDLAREFLEITRRDRLTPSCDITDGLKVLEVLAACRESERARREVFVPFVL
jgi:hypothetical protein